MVTVQVDLHTHTLLSGHAFSTIGENAAVAAQRGMQAIGMTDHLSPLFSSKRESGLPDLGPMTNMAALPQRVHGVRVLAGVEVDIVDARGGLYLDDLPDPHRPGQTMLEGILRTREIAIASVHAVPPEAQGSVAVSTELYIGALRRPGVHMLGHIGRTHLPFDVDAVLLEAKARGKLIEINEHSFDFGAEIQAHCRRIAERCAALGTYIAVGSDAHSAYYVGDFSRAIAMLTEIGFPQALIANATLDGLLKVLDAQQAKACR